VFKLVVARHRIGLDDGGGDPLARDCANQILLLVGTREAAKPPTPKHPLGRGRAAYFWSFMVALMIFLGGGVFSIYEGIHKLEANEPLENEYAAYAVLDRRARDRDRRGAAGEARARRAEEPGETFWQSLWHSKDADLVVLFAENTADVLGLALALGALLLAGFTGRSDLRRVREHRDRDPLCSASFGLTLKVKSLLQGESADRAVEDLFRKEVAADPKLEEVLTILTIQQGPGQVMLAAKVRLAPASRPSRCGDHQRAGSARERPEPSGALAIRRARRRRLGQLAQRGPADYRGGSSHV
jgi:hypothetical protein